MRRVIALFVFCLFIITGIARANSVRMKTLTVGDYIDDVINIRVYPHQILIYQNTIYGDIERDDEDFGIIVAPQEKFGSFACWHTDRFNLGYARSLFKFDIGGFGSPIKDHLQFGFGIGRAFFTRRLDFSFISNGEANKEWYQLNLRFSRRKGDFVIVPKYTLTNYFDQPPEYVNHRIGFLLQRLILNEGFVYIAPEYQINEGDIRDDFSYFYAGLELPLNKTFVLRFGSMEKLSEEFELMEMNVEPGIGLRIREFNIDFHLNKKRLADEDAPLIDAFGVDLNFGRF